VTCRTLRDHMGIPDLDVTSFHVRPTKPTPRPSLPPASLSSLPPAVCPVSRSNGDGSAGDDASSTIVSPVRIERRGDSRDAMPVPLGAAAAVMMMDSVYGAWCACLTAAMADSESAIHLHGSR
jgi:hypothetical protein